MRLLFLISLWSPLVLGMNCESGESIFENQVARADVIFTATAVSDRSVKHPNKKCREATHSDPLCGDKIVVMKVDKVWKGKVGETVRVFFDDACACLGAFVYPKSAMLVFARAAQGKPEGVDLIANTSCLGTSSLITVKALNTQVKLKAMASGLK